MYFYLFTHGMIRHLKKTLGNAYKQYLKFCKVVIPHQTDSNSDLHDIRVFFKHLKAYNALFVSLNKKHTPIKKSLLAFYKAVGEVRDAKIFYKHCRKFMPHDKAIHTYAHERIHEQETHLSKVYEKYSPYKLLKNISSTVKEQNTALQALKAKTIMPKLIAYLKTKESAVNKELKNTAISDAALHGIRTMIKEMLYLLTYSSTKDTPYLQSKVNLYTSLGQSLGRRNDLTQFTTHLSQMHRTAPQQITFNKLITLQQQKKLQLIEQLRQHFTTTALPVEKAIKKIIVKKQTPKKSPIKKTV